MVVLREPLVAVDWFPYATRVGSSIVPFANDWIIARGWSQGKLELKSVHRGIETAQSQALYACAQSSQVRASEYCAEDVVLQAV